MQRVDLIVDGKLKNTSQKSDLPAFQKRVTAAYQTAGETIIRRSGIPHTPPVVSFTPVIFTAQNPLAALAHPWPGRVVVSADHSFRAAVLAALPTLKARFGAANVGAWSDCKPAGIGTPPEVAIALMETQELGFWIGEAESRTAAKNCLDAGATEIIGNAASLLIPDGHGGEVLGPEGQAIISRKITFHQEAYWGDSPGAPSTVSAQGIPARLAPGIYPQCHTAPEYVADMPALKIHGGALGAIYYAEGGDWTAFL